MKTLITGGAGYIGSHTTLALLEAGREVVVLDDFSNSSPDALRRVGELAGREVEVVEGDSGDRETLNKVFDRHGAFSAVIHFAAFKSVSESTEKPLAYYLNNVAGSITLLEVMEEYGARNFVFSSSCTVYGEPQAVPLREDHLTGQVSSPYGATKYMVEKILSGLCAADSRWNAAILRYFNPVGAHPSALIGEDPLGKPENLVPVICQVATGKLDSLSIFGGDYSTLDGTCVRDYLHVVDLADAHLKALDHLAKVDGLRTFNLGTGRGTTVLELVDAFERATGQKIPRKVVQRRPGDVAEAWANPSLAKKVLGWEATRDLDEMMVDAWRWQLENPQGHSRGSEE
ncbi:MAG: UDP-glucose 4-epimerase GalE [Opitutae bacterium]|nr:UDP-glucose 4-epimerase GalE [Opitutae bacterium]